MVSTCSRTLRSLLVLTAWLLAAASAAAQAQPLQPLQEVPERAPNKLALAEPAEPPSLRPPLYYMLLPGAALLITGGILWSQYQNDVGHPGRKASGYLMTFGGILAAGSPFYLGARIAKRRRWTLQRRWEACGKACTLPEPRRYYGAFMIVPGVVLTLASGGALVHDFLRWSASEGDDPDDPDPPSYTKAQGTTLVALLGIGTTLIVAGSLHLVALNRQHADWRQRTHTLSRVRVAPTMRPGAAASRSFGLVVSGQF
jgi:hypothetical protein